MCMTSGVEIAIVIGGGNILEEPIGTGKRFR